MSTPPSLVQVIVDGIQKKPQTKAEAIALVQYVFESEVKPLCAQLLTALVALCPAPLQPEVQAAIVLAEDFLTSAEVEAVLVKSCGGCGGS